MIAVFREKDCYGEMNVRTCLHKHKRTSFCLVCNKIMLGNPHTFLMKTGSKETLINTNSRSTYRQTLGYNKFILRQAPLPGVFSPSRGRCRHYADRGADRQTSLSEVALQGQRNDLTELILSVDFVYKTIEN